MKLLLVGFFVTLTICIAKNDKSKKIKNENKNDKKKVINKPKTNEKHKYDNIKELSPTDFEKLRFPKKGSKEKWLIVFYTDKCDYCDKVLEIVDNDIDSYFVDVKCDIHFGSINCSKEKNVWIDYQLGITHVPRIILVEQGKYVDYINYPRRDDVVKLIMSDTAVKKGVPLPTVFPSFWLRNYAALDLLATNVREFCQAYLKKRKIQFELNKCYAYILMAICFTIVVIIEKYIASFFVSLLCPVWKKEDKTKEKKEEIENKIDESNSEDKKNDEIKNTYKKPKNE